MSIRFSIIFFVAGVMSCSQNVNDNQMNNESDVLSTRENQVIQKDVYINESGSAIKERFNVPKEFERNELDTLSFAYYLRHLPLKVHGATVKLYNGGSKPDHNVYLAVVDKEIGTRDLHQCADAVMRLRAEFLYGQKRYDEIHFNLTNGFNVPYAKWMEGNRVKVVGNATSWVSKNAPSNTYKDFWQYIEFIFSYAGTLSLDKELESILSDDLSIGDVFIKGGSPGHAVIVVDLIENKETGEKKFMLAQSYMPAQEIQVLRNPANGDKDNPWYDLNNIESLTTPEWTFTSDQLKQFREDL